MELSDKTARQIYEDVKANPARAKFGFGNKAALVNIDPEPAYQDVRNFFPTGHKPVSMVIGVSALAIPELLLEINVRAIVEN